MKKFLLAVSLLAASMFVANEASAQIKAGEGQVSIALESNNTYYTKDQKLIDAGIYIPGSQDSRTKGDFGSNDYLKVDYNLGRFSAGVQLDGYLPGLFGYDIYKYQQRDSKMTAFLSKYVQWEDKNWGVRLGDIYDQFGNGLIFRAYEERALALNNSLAGGRAYYNFNNFVNVKVVAGMPRLYDVRSSNWVYGADLALSISEMTGWQNGILSLEGSYVGRHQNDAVEEFGMIGVTTENLNMVSGRLNLEVAGFSFRGEYAAKLNEDVYDPVMPAKKGNVVHLDLGYNYKRFSVSATFRRQEYMTTPIELRPEGIGGGNSMNYVPLLTRQHTYMLANLNPYRGTSIFTGGEIGGQVDVYYSLRNKKARGKYWNFHANFSMFNTLNHENFGMEFKSRNAWIDFNFDIERQWNKQLKTTFFYSFQRWDEELNHFDSDHADYCRSHIFVGDVTYKFNKKHSLRVEGQYLVSGDYEGDWVAALVEYNFAPKFSFYVSDMWNWEPMDENYSYASEKHELLHYYQVGATFTHKFLRAQLSYGRNREGYVCSGGQCRYQPAYTGVNLAFTLTF